MPSGKPEVATLNFQTVLPDHPALYWTGRFKTHVVLMFMTTLPLAMLVRYLTKPCAHADVIRAARTAIVCSNIIQF